MPALAIDFGTSNSAAAICVEGHPKILELEPERSTIPSALFFDSETKRTLFGSLANRAVIDRLPGRYMRSMKSVLGTSLMHENFMALGKRTNFVEIIGLYLREIKARAETATGQNYEEVLSGRPVFFHSGDETRNAKALEDLKECYAYAGFDTVAFLPEPEAAAFAVGRNVQAGGVGLVIDIGGGTSDFALFSKSSDDEITILKSHGERVGGTDLDRLLSYHQFMPLLGRNSELGRTSTGQMTLVPNHIYSDLSTWEKINNSYEAARIRQIDNWARNAKAPELLERLKRLLTEQNGHRLLSKVEATKIALSSAFQGTETVDLDLIEADLKHAVTTDQMNESIDHAVEKIIGGIDETIAQSALSKQEISDIIFVGGTGTLPLLQERAAHVFSSARKHTGSVFTAIIDGLAQTLCNRAV